MLRWSPARDGALQENVAHYMRDAGTHVPGLERDGLGSMAGLSLPDRLRPQWRHRPHEHHETFEAGLTDSAPHNPTPTGAASPDRRGGSLRVGARIAVGLGSARAAAGGGGWTPDWLGALAVLLFACSYSRGPQRGGLGGEAGGRRAKRLLGIGACRHVAGRVAP